MERSQVRLVDTKLHVVIESSVQGNDTFPARDPFLSYVHDILRLVPETEYNAWALGDGGPPLLKFSLYQPSNGQQFLSRFSTVKLGQLNTTFYVPTVSGLTCMSLGYSFEHRRALPPCRTSYLTPRTLCRPSFLPALAETPKNIESDPRAKAGGTRREEGRRPGGRCREGAGGRAAPAGRTGEDGRRGRGEGQGGARGGAGGRRGEEAEAEGPQPFPSPQAVISLAPFGLVHVWVRVLALIFFYGTGDLTPYAIPEVELRIIDTVFRFMFVRRLSTGARNTVWV